MLIRCLIAVPGRALRRRLLEQLAGPDLLTTALPKGEDLFESLGREGTDLVLIAPGSVHGPLAAAVADIRSLPDCPEVAVLTTEEDAEERAALLIAGALAVLPEGLPDAALRNTLESLLNRRRSDARLRAERGPSAEGYHLSDFATESPAMARFMEMVSRVVASDSSLLVLGETGVGKEWLSRAIHAESPRQRGPFLAVNCAALPENLLESELFGHERGAFTGAVRAHRGAFELSHGGTIFLDEVGEIATHLQAKLLRVLQERQVRRVGGESALGVNVRVIAATNRDLEAEVRARRFRADLFYRLGVVTLTIPPLRERREDIPTLVRGSALLAAARLHRRPPDVEEDALAAMLAYDWPGNVRELLNVIERAMLLCTGDSIGLADLPPSVASGTPYLAFEDTLSLQPAGDESVPLLPWKEARSRALAQAERAYLVRLLQATHGRVGEAAKHAGISARALYDKMRRHALDKDQYR